MSGVERKGRYHMEDIELKLLIGLHRVCNEIDRRSSQLVSKYNLSLGQFAVLEALYHKGDLSVGEVQRKILSSSGTMPVIIRNLEKRGYLNRIHRGDIPLCLSHLPICPHCRVPMPLNSMHCDTCKTCVLRYDHHCGVVGQCIADKNIKAFILSFFYAFLFGESSALTGITFCISDKNSQSFDIMKVLVLIGSLYSGVVGLSLFSFGLATVFHQITAYMSADNDHSSFVRHRKFKFFKMFGNEWWQMLIPIQSTTTYLAWPGIRWNEEYQL